MQALLLLLGLMAVLLVALAMRETRKIKLALGKGKKSASLLPKAISMVLVAAQLSELLKLLEHAGIAHVALGLMLLAVSLAARSGAEEV